MWKALNQISVPGSKYALTNFQDQARLVWLSDSRIELGSANLWEDARRTFDLAADPPKPIPSFLILATVGGEH